MAQCHVQFYLSRSHYVTANVANVNCQCLDLKTQLVMQWINVTLLRRQNSSVSDSIVCAVAVGHAICSE